MNPPVSPQQLREIARVHNAKAGVDWARGRDETARQLELSAQALKRWASQLESEAMLAEAATRSFQNYKAAADMCLNTTPHTDKG